LARFWRIFAAVGLFVWPLPVANAQTRSTSPSGCRFDTIGAGEVSKIIDGRSFILNDGREMRLAGIEVPLLPRPGVIGTGADAAIAAQSNLQAMLQDQPVELRQRLRGSMDRYGRLLVFAFFMRDGLEKSAVHEVLTRGFARLSADIGAQVGEQACMAELRLRERAAREAKLGLWAEPYYAVIGAESLTELLAQRDRFAVVEGRVWSVRESAGTIYMNFGRRWSQALTVTIAKRNERDFTTAGLAPSGLERARVQVRGWLEERNGPRIEASRPEQIEIIGR
jgi:endonuclease YncB( thermonuclease family)